MKVIKAVYNEESKFIVDIVEGFKDTCIIETFNMDHHQQAKKGRPILTRMGTSNLPVVVFEDENLEEVSAIWPEQEPSWEVWIAHTLKEIA